MRKPRSQLQFVSSNRDYRAAFQTGISLHSHTIHSKEGLSCLPQYLEKVPVVSQFLQWENERHFAMTGRKLDFSQAYWRGPLTARTAYELERRQIEALGLRAMVSLTDHDSIEAGLQLQRNGTKVSSPISVEWTVPFEETCFHIGVHNLRGDHAVSLMAEMAGYTRDPRHEILSELVERLDSNPAVLIVVNHPLWLISTAEMGIHLLSLQGLLKRFGQRIHALEFNGLRPWKEIMDTIDISEEFGLPVVSGGDRHGFEPNATINLTNAKSFSEFVSEVRNGRSSNIAIMPQYREPLPLRQLGCAWDAVREAPQVADQPWPERVFVRCPDGIERPLAKIWAKKAHAWIDPCMRLVGLILHPQFGEVLRWAFTAGGSAM
jgi:hypothetical protein